MQKNHLSKVKNSQLELEKDFMKLKDKLKHKREKIKKRDRKTISSADYCV